MNPSYQSMLKRIHHFIDSLEINFHISKFNLLSFSNNENIVSLWILGILLAFQRKLNATKTPQLPNASLCIWDIIEFLSHCSILFAKILKNTDTCHEFPVSNCRQLLCTYILSKIKEIVNKNAELVIVLWCFYQHSP